MSINTLMPSDVYKASHSLPDIWQKPEKPVSSVIAESKGNELAATYKGANGLISPGDPRLTVIGGKVQCLAVIRENKDGTLDMSHVMFHPDQSLIKERNMYDLDNPSFDPVSVCQERGAGYGGAIPMSETFRFAEANTKHGVTKYQEVTGKDAEFLKNLASEHGLSYIRNYTTKGRKASAERTVVVPVAGDMTPDTFEDFDGSYRRRGHRITGLAKSSIHDDTIGISQTKFEYAMKIGREAELTKKMMLQDANITLSGPVPTAEETRAYADRKADDIRSAQIQAKLISPNTEAFGPNMVRYQNAFYQGDIHVDINPDGKRSLSGVSEEAAVRFSEIEAAYTDDANASLVRVNSLRYNPDVAVNAYIAAAKRPAASRFDIGNIATVSNSEPEKSSEALF